MRAGALLCGTLRKAQLGSSAGGIVDVLCREWGGDGCLRFIADAQRVANAYLLQRGHAVGMHDAVLSAAGQAKVDERLGKATRLCEEIQREAMAADAPASLAREAEGAILRLLSKTLMQAGSIVQAELPESNAIRRMVTAGSKGSAINLSQICATLGQQSLEGGRIVAEKGDRTLPCFAPNDASLASRGMVHNSFALGLAPAELFMHAVGGREGLVDTAVKTSRTGYLQRRMNKAMEDHRTHADGTVRTAAGDVVSFRYGADGLAPARVERAPLPFLAEPAAAVRARMTPAEAELALACRAAVLATRAHVLAAEVDTRVLLPFNPRRVRARVERAVADAAGPGAGPSSPAVTPAVTPAAASARVCELAARVPRAVGAALLDALCASAVAGMPAAAHAALLDELALRCEAARAVPGESVGCLAAQSVGEPATQLTLNSVDWHTTMVIRWTATTPPPAPAEAEVGAFVDALIAERPHDVQLQPDGVTVYLPLPPGSAVALSPDADGRMKWTALEAVTRHPPINRDGSNTLVEVTTESGRTVVVTKGKSLLVERAGKLVEADGDAVRVGDRVPVVHALPAAAALDHLDLRSVYLPTEVVYTDVMVEAMAAAAADRRWFLHGNFKQRSCYNRSDAMRDAVKTRPALLEPGKVVLPQGGHYLPDRIPLDRDFGFFVGAYLAEGCLTDYQVHISNVDEAYRAAARAWPDRHGIQSHVTNEKHRQKNNGTSISIMFHTTLVAQLLARTCGKLSAGKRVPGFAYAAPDAFVEGLLDGYFSGDGSVDKKNAYISASSRSRQLRDGIALLLARFGVGCKLRTGYMLNHVQWTTEADGRRTQVKYGERTPHYKLSICGDDVHTFASHVSLVLDYKAARCAELLQGGPNKRTKTAESDLDDDLDDLDDLDDDFLNDVRLEAIVALKELPSSHEFVYDLTVAETRNMTATNGLASRDTFHTAGAADHTVTQGIPRLSELLDASKAPKTPCTTVRLRAGAAASRECAEYLAATLPLTRLGDLVARCDIVPADAPCAPEEAWLAAADEALGARCEAPSRYVVRLELQRALMRTRQLTPPMVRALLRERLGGRALVSATEANAVDWVVRVRFAQVAAMAARGCLGDQESILCHRAANVLLDTVVVSGHPRVTAAAAAEAPRVALDPRTGVAAAAPEWVVHVHGAFLADCASSELVDWARCTSNDIWEVLHTLGVEAAVHTLFHQLHGVVSYDGSYVDERHLLLICDTVCRGGTLMPLNRHGINKTDASPLMRCSFEETVDVLNDAAMFAERDESGKGVSTAIMTGQLAALGTGAAEVLFHERCAPPSREVVLAKPRGRVVRSTVRAHAPAAEVEEVLEYVFGDVRPVGTRPLSPPTVGPAARKRVRFRPESPPPA